MASTAITNLPTWFTRWPGSHARWLLFYLAARPAFPAALAPSFEKAASKRCSSSGVIVRRPSSSFDRSLWWSPTSAQNRDSADPERLPPRADRGALRWRWLRWRRRRRGGRRPPGPLRLLLEHEGPEAARRLDERHRCRGELLGGGLDILERLVAGAELLGLGHAVASFFCTLRAALTSRSSAMAIALTSPTVSEPRSSPASAAACSFSQPVT